MATEREQPVVPSTDLASVAQRFREGIASGHELTLAFVGATVFCVHTEEPGFLAIGEEGAGYVPFYSSERALAEVEGECRWFAARAADVLQAIPKGYGVVVDPGLDTEVVLPATAFARVRN